jgi:hypothetical protein
MAGGALKNKRGVVHLTNDRLFFNDQRFDTSLGGLAGTLSEALEKLRKEHPPMIDLVLTDITRIAHVTKLTVRDILVVETAAGESRFANGFKTMSPLLRQALTERHGRRVVDDGADAWLVEALSILLDRRLAVRRGLSSDAEPFGGRRARSCSR